MILRIASTLLLTAACISLLPACSQSKKAQHSQQAYNQSASLKPGFDVSPLTKMFLKDLEKALDSTSVALDKFEPSAIFAAKHGLAQENGKWLIAGLIKTGTGFNEQAMKDAGVLPGSLSGNIVTARVPLAALPQFLHMPGITYFEKIQVKTTNK